LLRPLDVGCPDIELRFARRLAGLPHLRNEGTWSVPRVVHGAWEAPDGAVGLVFVDVSPAAGPPVTLDTTLDALGAGDLSGRPAQLVTREARHELATITAGNRLSVELPLTPSRIAVLEILPPAGQGR
jgi:hypothetical protein